MYYEYFTLLNGLLFAGVVLFLGWLGRRVYLRYKG